MGFAGLVQAKPDNQEGKSRSSRHHHTDEECGHNFYCGQERRHGLLNLESGQLPGHSRASPQHHYVKRPALQVPFFWKLKILFAACKKRERKIAN